MKDQGRATRRATKESKANTPKITKSDRVKGENYKRKSKHKGFDF